eukprot:scaffold120289_cov51-Phaeocystis_antarctica.AAC.1
MAPPRLHRYRSGSIGHAHRRTRSAARSVVLVLVRADPGPNPNNPNPNTTPNPNSNQVRADRGQAALLPPPRALLRTTADRSYDRGVQRCFGGGGGAGWTHTTQRGRCHPFTRRSCRRGGRLQG